MGFYKGPVLRGVGVMTHILDLNLITSREYEEALWEVTVGEYRYAIFPHKALVYKGDAVVPSYTITGEDGCDCKSATLGGRVCKHMQAVRWVGDGDESSTAPTEQSDGMVDLSELLSGE